MINKTVRIDSEEFKNAVLEIIKKENLILNGINDPRFERLPDGWIKDNDLDVDWGPSSEYSINFGRAELYCKSLGGRMPTVDELLSLVDCSIYEPAINKNVFKDTKCAWYWTSKKTAWSTSARYVVGFNHGCVTYKLESSCTNYVRPCRDSKC